MHDAVELEVFRHRISAVAEAMGAALQHASSSPNIKERLDYSCAVFDRQGRLLAQAAHIPVHLGAMPATVEAARASITTWRPGDIVVLNHPYLGGSHLPDITSVSPVFAGNGPQPDLFLATRAHHADVGGVAPGSLGGARDLFGEGLVLPPVRLCREGTIDEDLVAIVCANSRTPDERRGDLEAQIAAHHVGAERLHEMLQANRTALHHAAETLLDYSERRVRARLESMPSGCHSYEDWLEGDGVEDGPLRIRVTLTVRPDRFEADFTGTAAQVTGGVNMPLSVTRSAVCYVFACLMTDVPINEGTFRPVGVLAPPGSLVNALHPAAVAAGNVETSQRVVDVLLGALAVAMPGHIPAASQGTMNNLSIGGTDPRTGRPFTYYETTGGGSGAGPSGHGASAIQVHMTNTRNTPVEALETAYPLRVESCRVRRSSGGAGKHHGGDGIERCIRLLAPALVTVIAERHESGPPGRGGGLPGAPGSWRVTDAHGEHTLPAKTTVQVQAGDVLVLQTPGGGGWGRELPEQSREEVQDDEQGRGPGHDIQE